MEKKTTKSKKVTIEMLQCSRLSLNLYHMTFKVKQIYTAIVSKDVEGCNFYYLDGKYPSNKEEVENYITMDLIHNY